MHIFEPRYIQMFQDAVKEDGIIGMIQPMEDQSQTGGLFSTGCAGKIIQHEETDDGRILLSLRGLCRFEVINEEDNDRLYRTVEVDYLPTDNTKTDDADNSRHRRLVNAITLYLPTLDQDIDLSPVLDAGLSELATVLTMHLPFSSEEKQSLLEAENVDDRVDQLIQLLEQATLDNWINTDAVFN